MFCHDGMDVRMTFSVVAWMKLQLTICIVVANATVANMVEATTPSSVSMQTSTATKVISVLCD